MYKVKKLDSLFVCLFVLFVLFPYLKIDKSNPPPTHPHPPKKGDNYTGGNEWSIHKSCIHYNKSGIIVRDMYILPIALKRSKG